MLGFKTKCRLETQDWRVAIRCLMLPHPKKHPIDSLNRNLEGIRCITRSPVASSHTYHKLTYGISTYNIHTHDTHTNIVANLHTNTQYPDPIPSPTHAGMWIGELMNQLLVCESLHGMDWH